MIGVRPTMIAALLAAVAVTSGLSAASTANMISVGYTSAQASRGSVIYRESCSQCHGSSLGNGEFGPPLRGGNFRAHWRGRPASGLYVKIATMPPGAANSLGQAAYSDVMAFILSSNGIPAGRQELTSDLTRLRTQIIPN